MRVIKAFRMQETSINCILLSLEVVKLLILLKHAFAQAIAFMANSSTMIHLNAMLCKSLVTSQFTHVCASRTHFKLVIYVAKAQNFT